MSQLAPLTDELFSAFLRCRYKAYLKLTGVKGESSDYTQLQHRLSASYRMAAMAEWLAGRPKDGVIQSPTSLLAAIDERPLTITDAVIIDADEVCHIDGLERGASRKQPRGAAYSPVLFVPHERLFTNDRLLLAYAADILGRVQRVPPQTGTIVHGSRFSATKVDLKSLIEPVRQIVEETKPIREGMAVPLVLNRHCPKCEFRRRCHAAAVEKDDLSLLTGLTPKEIAAQNRKGIFTVTQYSYTFRPGRMKRIVESGGRRHDCALQALALRERAIHVTQREPVVDAKVKIFLDVEGLTDPDRYYLIGLLIVTGHSSRRLSLWADGVQDEATIWTSFLAAIQNLDEEFVIYHYGSYESSFVRRMTKVHGGDPELLARIKARVVNVLALIQGRLFFPTHGNDLKSIAGYLGFRWSVPEPSGLQAIAWRHDWESVGNEAVKQQLITYNQEDCSALECVVEAIRFIGAAARTVGLGKGSRVVSVDEIEMPRGHKFGDPDFVLPEFNRIIKCSYFDYQRARVLFRTSPAVKRAIRNQERRFRRACTVNEVQDHECPSHCPQCGSSDNGVRNRHTRLIVDLKSVRGGLKRWVTRHNATRRFCRPCNRTWVSEEYPAADEGLKRGRAHRYGWALCGWAAYVTVALRQTNLATVEALNDFFGVTVSSGLVSRLRAQAADRYRGTYESLLVALRGGPLVHVDETWAKTKGVDKRGYVWVFANPEVAVYIHSPTREGETLRKALTGFKGVLVSDFYGAYDGMDCPQQKCLVHLARDINDDLVKRPFDEELKQLAGRFAKLMQAVVETIDRYGLKRYHLRKHKADVDRFYAQESAATYTSEAARHYRQRFLKYQDKLFTFLDHDGVPWSNNNAENAVKRFVSRRAVLGGTGAFSERGIQDYLLLLSLYQTLRYRGASFWQFLQSRETDIEAFLRKHREHRSSTATVRASHRRSSVRTLPNELSHQKAAEVDLEGRPNLDENELSRPDFRASQPAQTSVATSDSSEDETTRSLMTSRNWYVTAACDNARVPERVHVEQLLKALCDGIVSPAQPRRGRKPYPLRDAIFACVMKVYVGLSGRRASTAIRDCAERGHIANVPHFNTVLAYLERTDTTEILTWLVEESARPLAWIENSRCAIDSAGLSTVTYDRWFGVKHEPLRASHWIKLQVMVGTVTQVVCGVKVSSEESCPEVRERFGIQVFNPFNVNAVMVPKSETWSRHFREFVFNSGECLRRCDRRNSVKSVMRMVEIKFGAASRSKLPTAQVNETLAKCLCHNLDCTARAILAAGLAPRF